MAGVAYRISPETRIFLESKAIHNHRRASDNRVYEKWLMDELKLASDEQVEGFF